MTLRSYLFVPASRPERIDKALAAGAHAVIVDLEDAVGPADKDSAREALERAWSTSDAARFLVRVNGADTAWFEADLRTCARSPLAGVVLPKAEEPAQVARVRDALGATVPVLALVETARGVWNAHELASTPGLVRLIFGSIDFAVDLNARDEALAPYRAQLVLASRVAGIAPPVDGVTTAIDDAELIARETRRARAEGFGGKLCIHPKQVAIVNAEFAPTGDEVAWARRVVAADAAAGGAATSVDGKMIDKPVLLRARAILEEAPDAA